MRNNIFTVTCILVLLSFLGCSKQTDGYVIEGNVEGFKDSTKIFMNNFETNEIEMAYIINGRFTFTGKVEHPIEVSINENMSTKDAAILFLWLENSKITIEGTRSNFYFANIFGSKSQQIADKKRVAEAPYYKEIIHLDQKVKEENDIDKRKSMNSRIVKIHSIFDSIAIDFAIHNYNSYPGISALKNIADLVPKETLKNIMEDMEPQYLTTKSAQNIKIYLNAIREKDEEGFIEIKMNTIDGKKFILSNFIGEKYILLDFWSIACGPCRYGNKFLVERYNDFKEKLEIVGIVLNKDKESILKALKTDNIPWTILSDFKGDQGEAHIQYAVKAIPTYFLINPEGKIVWKEVGFSPQHYDEIMKIVNAEK